MSYLYVISIFNISISELLNQKHFEQIKFVSFRGKVMGEIWNKIYMRRHHHECVAFACDCLIWHKVVFFMLLSRF